MQAVKRFEPDKGFRLANYAMWWIKAAIQEYILRSWSLVKMGTTANQKKLFFNLRKAKSRISALDEGDMRLFALTQVEEQLRFWPAVVPIVTSDHQAAQDARLERRLGDAA